jgi:hypothetical protein
VQQRQAKAGAAGAIPTKPVRVVSTATTETKEAEMARFCSEPGCGKRLSSNNKIGLCFAHGGDGAHVRFARDPRATCSEPGCTEKIYSTNRSGKCGAHDPNSHHAHSGSAAPAVHSAPTNGGNGAPAAAVHHATQPTATTSTKPNGAKGHGNGHARPPSNGHDLALEERVSLVMTRIPLQDRLAFISRWIIAGKT